MRRGELSINVIIMIALGLIVLVVLIALLFKANSNARTFDDCVKIGGTCQNLADECSGQNYGTAPCNKGSDVGKTCCVTTPAPSTT